MTSLAREKNTQWLCIGDIGLDIYQIQDEEAPLVKFGGISLNHMAHLVSLGEEKVSFLGPLSNDVSYKKLKDQLMHWKVKILDESEYDGLAPRQYISLSEEGEKNFIKYEEGVLKNFIYKKLEKKFDKILMPVFSQNWHWVSNVLNNPPEGQLICDFLDGKDFHQNLSFLESWNNKIDLLVVGCPPKDEEFFDSLRKNRGLWSRRVLVTRGHGEGFYFDGHKEISFTPKPVEKVIDSTGAGDAFLIRFLVSLEQGFSGESALDHACLYAQEQLLKLGAH